MATSSPGWTERPRQRTDAPRRPLSVPPWPLPGRSPTPAAAPCLPALAAARPLIAAIHALQRTPRAALAALLAFAVTGLACLSVVLAAPVLIANTTPQTLSLALGLAISLGAFAFMILLLRVLALNHTAPDLKPALKSLRLPLALSLVMAGLCRAGAAYFPEHSLALVLALVPGCALGYGVACLAAGCPEARQLMKLLFARKKSS